MKLIIILLVVLFSLTCQLHARSHHHSYKFLAADKETFAKLSSVIFPTNIGGLIEFNAFLENIRPYNLTQGETRALFRLCDRDRDDRLSAEEWDGCLNVFVQPYESNCLSSKKDYLLATKDITKCLKLPFFSHIPTRVPNKEKIENLVLEILNRVEEKKINFVDYIFLRRLSFAWGECSVDNRINKRRMECALSATTPQKRKFLPVANQVFNIAIQLYKTKVKENEAFLDFFSFAKIAYIYYYFNEFELPYQEENISKKALIQGIEDQILPSSVTVEFVNQVFYALDPDNNGFNLKLDFAAYASVNHLFSLYRKYAETNKKGRKNFTEKAFEKMIKEQEWENFDLVLMDNVYSLDDKEFNSLAELKDGNNSLGVNDREYFTYFTRFAQSQADQKKKYQTIFNIFDTQMKKSWNFTSLVDFAKFTWAFQLIDVENNGHITNDDVQLFLRGYKTLIPFNIHEVKKFETIAETIRSENINVKEFYSFFTYHTLFKNLQISGSLHALTLTNLKLGMENLGLKVSNETRRIAKEFLAASKLPSYNYQKAFKRAIKEEILLNKVAKMKSQDKKYVKNDNELKQNALNYKKYFETEMKGDMNWGLNSNPY